MASSPVLYTRLTRNAAGIGSYSSLWLGTDHLLLVRSTGYHETYARLQFRDLKAVFVTPTLRRRVWGVVWGVLLVPSALTFALSAPGGATPLFSGLGVMVGAAGLIWNHLLGQGGRALAVTEVQTVDLPGLVRLGSARRVLARLQPLILAAQAHLPQPAASPPPAPPPLPPSTLPT